MKKTISATLPVGDKHLKISYTNPSKTDTEEFIDKMISTALKLCGLQAKFKSQLLIDLKLVKIDSGGIG